ASASALRAMARMGERKFGAGRLSLRGGVGRARRPARSGSRAPGRAPEGVARRPRQRLSHRRREGRAVVRSRSGPVRARLLLRDARVPSRIAPHARSEGVRASARRLRDIDVQRSPAFGLTREPGEESAMPSQASSVSRKVGPMAIRGIFRGLSAVAPGTASVLAGALFRTPPRPRQEGAEQTVWSRGGRLDMRLDGRRLAVGRWNEGPPVLLVHGWGSRGARLSSFIEPLGRAGFSTIAFDAPGHGDSGGRLSSLPQFIAAIETIVDRLGVPVGIVAHSMGSAASSIARKRGLAPKAAVFIAPAANPAAWTGRFASIVGVSDEVIGRMTRSFERKFGYCWTDFDVPRVAAPFLTAPLL